MAYYRCAACGAKLETKHARADRALRAKVRPFDAPDELPAEPAAKPAANPGESPGPAQPSNPPRAQRRAGFWNV
ncbi:hypothetical protein [Burkholderia perseverans]|uniref:hypothetical protein n=1 Tax=Burkholderia perseverans TaxID=2615214 RepID=UPI001FED4AD2|nr:hypothetical protein [Burkholderia perseverans]